MKRGMSVKIWERAVSIEEFALRDLAQCRVRLVAKAVKHVTG